MGRRASTGTLYLDRAFSAERTHTSFGLLSSLRRFEGSDSLPAKCASSTPNFIFFGFGIDRHEFGNRQTRLVDDNCLASSGLINKVRQPSALRGERRPHFSGENATGVRNVLSWCTR